MAEIQVELLKASYGDCIFININYDGKSFVIMIDGGPSYSYRHKERGRMKPGALQDKLDVPVVLFVDDIVEGVYRVMQGAPERKKGEDGLPIPPYAVYNIGGGQPENLLDFVNILQEELVRAGVLPADFDFEAHKQLVPMQLGDVPVTYADATALERDFGFTPKITLREGLRKFAQWYKEYYA